MQDFLLSVIGFLFCLYHFKNLLDVIWFYFLRPTDAYKKYLTGPHSYALITGATDGIGKALAKELYDKGFNLIIHGRNEEKILSVIDELKNSSSSGGDVKYFVADANRPDVDFEGIAKGFEGLNVTLMVNNIGGVRIRLERYRVHNPFSKHSLPRRLITIYILQGSTNGPRKSTSSWCDTTRSFQPSSHEHFYPLFGTQLVPARYS